MIFDKSHTDYKNSKMRQEIWEVIASKVGTIDGKLADGKRVKTFFNAGKTKLTQLRKSLKSGSAAETSSKSSQREMMEKTFSFLKDHIVPSSYVHTCVIRNFLSLAIDLQSSK
jgi:Alcohol dehydrogenase transcription factor Myb/SANT-like